jgi:ABC-type lipoprotein release transport system permease subunit
MFKNYFKIAWRNLLKNKLSSIINIVGLGLAVGCCFVVFVFLIGPSIRMILIQNLTGFMW